MHVCAQLEVSPGLPGWALILLNGASGCRVLEAGERQEMRVLSVGWGTFGGAELSQGKC